MSRCYKYQERTHSLRLHPVVFDCTRTPLFWIVCANLLPLYTASAGWS
jgi:hypothetical protein